MKKLSNYEKGRLRREHYSKMSSINKRNFEESRHVLDGGAVYAPEKGKKSQNSFNQKLRRDKSSSRKNSVKMNFSMTSHGSKAQKRFKRGELISSGLLVDSEIFDSFNNEVLSGKVPTLNMDEISRSMNPNGDRVPLNSAQTLSRNSSSRLNFKKKSQRKTSRSKSRKYGGNEPYSSMYGNIVSTKRSRQKEELLKSNNYF